jgi:hypothetical protein
VRLTVNDVPTARIGDSIAVVARAIEVEAAVESVTGTEGVVVGVSTHPAQQGMQSLLRCSSELKLRSRTRLLAAQLCC